MRQCERDDYDRALLEYFLPYHVLADLMCRVAINHDLLTEPLVTLSVLLGIDGVPLHLAHFAKLWIDVYQTKVSSRRPPDAAGAYRPHVILRSKPCQVHATATRSGD